MSNIEKRIGSMITGVRLSQKLTQAQLAEKADLSVESISRMERGITLPSLKTLEKIANSLNAPLKTFFDFDEHHPKNPPYERELSKLISSLRTLSEKEITLLHDILRVILKKLKPSPEQP